ncbi:hypothetical protein ABXT08_07420 [Chryseobacterium sp. NRRL B-14859]|uniref:hypothetical protein n=1 Tax=Chryseobacterium sp. NRRL B-14859 TaxID=1562763 RepID=UPI00339AE3A8
MDEFTFEQTYIETQKSKFRILFGKDADENLELFIKYISDKTNRDLTAEISELNKHIEEISEKGFFDKED